MIHPSAVIDSGADLADDVEVGAYTVIGDAVSIDAGTRIGSHCVIQGVTQIGKDNRIFQFSSIGESPQDKKYAGEATRLIIGDRNVIREYCTLNRGTVQDKFETRLGSDNWVMAYVHIAHDCVVGDHTIFANGATLAGHVTIENYAILGGFTLVHQFCRIGQHAFTGMGSALGQDVPPFVLVGGNPAAPHGINIEGLRRRGFNRPRVKRLKEAYRLLYRSSYRLEEAIQEIQTLQDNAIEDDAELESLVQFLQQSERGIVR